MFTKKTKSIKSFKRIPTFYCRRNRLEMIYGLYTMRSLRGGRLLIEDRGTKGNTYNDMAEFAQYQPYCSEVVPFTEYVEDKSNTISWALNNWDKVSPVLLPNGYKSSMAELIAASCGQQYAKHVRWIDAPEDNTLKDRMVVTLHPDMLKFTMQEWNQFIEKTDSIVLSTQEEAAIYEHFIPKSRIVIRDTMLGMASCVNAARFVIGSPGYVMALAEALCKQRALFVVDYTWCGIDENTFLLNDLDYETFEKAVLGDGSN